MQIITTREFRANQKKYFELAEKETIFVSRRNAAPIVVYAATEEDFPSRTDGYIAKEIFSFVSAVVPEKCAREWMIQSGAMEPSEFLQAVADMEDVRLRAKLLALELAAMNVRYNVLDTIPWDRLN